IFSFSLFTPFFSGLSRKRPFEMCVYFFTVIVMPVFYFACYSNILIDPFLGMLIGAGISHIFLVAKKDIFYDIYMIMLLPVLALAKDAGQYFAAFLGVFFAYDHLNSKKIQGKITIRNIITAVLPLCAFAAARLVWKLELLSSDAMVSFGGKVDLIRYGKLIITGGGEGFEKISISSFIDAFFEKSLGISALDMQVNYFILFFLNMFLMYAAYKLLEKHEPEKKKTRLVIIWGTAVQTILYVYSLGATYISNFTQQEAAELAGYNRYMNIGFLPLWIIVLMSFLYYLSVYQNSSRFLLAALVLVLILVSPMESVIHFMMKKPVRYSVSYREQYNEISNKIMESCEDNSRIAYINQNTESDDSFLIVRYNVRPEHLLYFEYKLEKDSEGNVKTTASQMKDILAENYDYAAIYMINDDFINDYGELFENPEDIAENAVYSVDRETGLLSRTI
ncbi:MAG: hypothetical protein IJ805_07405, partial [Lachnospiraceae bacterium]|nr:hypothetical protein [Lachnospiraceae bacterium]